MMRNSDIVARLCQDFAPYSAMPTPAALLSKIERLAHEIARRAPEAAPQADEIVALCEEMREAGPHRDSVIEVIENVCGEDLSGSCVSRIADAVMKLCGSR
jgi:hypothetical protein